ncbi:MAG TPA: hypothetical protein VNX65_04445 [Patescibacteria group bacterium]|jgi:hypothetical protein|nr:hypothetical protein [Patescibacteria group bacterium]
MEEKKSTSVATQLDQPALASKKPRPKWTLKVLAIALLISGGIYLVKIDHSARKDFAVVMSQMEKIRQDSMVPMGAIEIAGGHSDGNGLLQQMNECGLDRACPNVTRVWHVAVEPGKEWDAIRTVTEKEGLDLDSQSGLTDSRCGLVSPNDCVVYGRKAKGNMAMLVGIDTDKQPPAQNVSPKIWRRVSVNITPYTTGPVR